MQKIRSMKIISHLLLSTPELTDHIGRLWTKVETQTINKTNFADHEGSGGDDVSHEGEDGSGGGSNNGGSGSGSKENSASPTRHASTQDED